MVIERLAQSLMLEAPFGPQPNELFIGGAFDLQRQIAFHLQATKEKEFKRTNGLSIHQALPFHEQAPFDQKQPIGYVKETKGRFSKL